MSINLESLSTKELSELISKANLRKKVLAKRKPANQVKAAVAKFLKSTGWTFDELYGRASAPKAAARPPRSSRARPPRAAASARSPRSTATRPMPRRPGPAAASSRAGWPRKPRRAASLKSS